MWVPSGVYRLFVRCCVPVGLVIAYIGLASNAITNNPLRMDEVDYFQCMANVTKMGLPLYYAREERIEAGLIEWLGSRQLADGVYRFYRFGPNSGVSKESYFAIREENSRYTWCMWHPPLYIYLGSVAFRLFDIAPQNSYVLRFHNLLYSVGAIWGMARLSMQLYQRNWYRAFSLGLLLYITCDLALRGSILIDYSAALAPCVTVWFVLAILRSVKRNHLSFGLVVMTALALGTSFGLAASLLLIASIWLSVYSVVDVRAGLPWRTALGLAFGVGLFIALYWFACYLLQLPFAQPFLHNSSRAGIVLSVQWMVSRLSLVYHYGIWYSREIGLATCSVFVALACWSVLGRWTAVTIDRLLLPVSVIIGVATQASLGGNAYGFPKYILFVLPLMFLFIGGEITKVIPGAGLWARASVVGLLAFLLGTQLSTTWATAIGPGYDLYNRGEIGVVEVGQTLSALTPDHEVLLCSKDVGFYAQRKFVEWYGPLLNDVVQLSDLVASEGVRYAARNLPVSEAVQRFLDFNFPRRSVVGGYEILGPVLEDR